MFVSVPHVLTVWFPNEKYFDSEVFEKLSEKNGKSAGTFLRISYMIKSHSYFWVYVYVQNNIKIVTNNYWARDILEYFSSLF